MGASMREAEEVLARLHDLGVMVKAEGENVLVGPAGRVTPEVKAVVTEHKQTLLEALRPRPQKGIGYGCSSCGRRVYTLIVAGWQCDHCRAIFEVIGGTRGPLPMERQNQA